MWGNRVAFPALKGSVYVQVENIKTVSLFPLVVYILHDLYLGKNKLKIQNAFCAYLNISAC